MGSSQSIPSFEKWQVHPTEPNTFYNTETQEKVVCHVARLSKMEQAFIGKRIQEQHNFVNRVLYFQPVQSSTPSIDDNSFYVYFEKTSPISVDKWIPTTSVLSILKGFRRLSSTYGPIRIVSSMIRLNDKKQIRVWVNEDPLKNQAMGKVENQERMLADIVRIVMQYDPSTGGLMMNCKTINEAINNILHSLAQNKAQNNLSNRTNTNSNKNEEKPKTVVKEPEVNQQKINFRSTKETEDDSLKMFHDSKKSQSRKQIPTDAVQNPKNLLQNVALPKQPTFINVDRPPASLNLISEPESSMARDFNYSQQTNNMQKVSSIQFNNSQPLKATNNSGRPLKVIERRDPPAIGSATSLSAINNEMSGDRNTAINEKNIGQLQKFQSLSKYYQPPGQTGQRRSNLNKMYIQRIETAQEMEFGSYRKGKGSITNEKSDINTSREIGDYPFNRPRMDYHGVHYDAGRTKTQQFYSSNYEQNGNSPRMRTNYTQSFHMQNQLSQQAQTLSSEPSQQLLQQSSQKDIQKQKVASQTESVTDEAERRKTKLKQAMTIQEEMSGLGILRSKSPRLGTDKSARDLLIKQKIQEKNKKHEELKFAITRLLSE